MVTVEERFYVTGGTLPLDADSYVARKADTDLLIGLRGSEFCYVLNTRQMGKSSLMIRTARRLKEDGFLVAILDMTAIGLNLSVDQWYLGMLMRIASQIGYEEGVLDYWRRNKDIGPMQRFVESLRQVVLMSPATASQSGGVAHVGVGAPTLVVFVDEIDSVRCLSFSADEFFAGIRQCYNRRAEDPAFARLTFCLIGVATPVDLIREARISPFNIGRRIELPDFTRDEAGLLAGRLVGKAEAGGMADANTQNIARRLLDRIFHWANGHPYMTQRLCKAVASMTTRRIPDALYFGFQVWSPRIGGC